MLSCVKMNFFDLILIRLNIEHFFIYRNISVKKGGYGVESRGTIV